MKIGIDISQIVYGTGVSVYTRNLVKELLSMDKVNDYVLYGGYLRRKEDLYNFTRTLHEKFVAKLYPIPPSFSDILWNRLHFCNIERFIGKLDIFHSSDWTQPPSDAYKVTTVHDLIPIKYPKQSTQRLVNVHKRRLYWVKKEADAIIAPSDDTKKDLVVLGFDKKKITVIGEAANEAINKVGTGEINRVKSKFRTGENYLLSIGVTPRKNTQRIIDSFELMRAGNNLRLVIVGQPHMKIDQTRGVIVIGHVSDKDLSALYSGTEALVYPSFYEGFGIPILDAYKCGVPVVTSDIGSMKELGSSAAVLVDPNSVESIVEGIKLALKNKKRLIKLGSDKLKAYSWKKTAEKTLGIYKGALKKAT